MAHRFTCGEKKIWQNIEKSQNIMKLIVGLIKGEKNKKKQAGQNGMYLLLLTLINL